MVSVKPVTSVKRRKAQCAIIIQFISKLHVHTIIKGYSLGSSSGSVSVSGEAGVLDWAPRSRSRVFVPYRHNIKKAPRLSALQLRSGSDGDGPHKSLLQPAAVHTFTVYRGLGIGSLVIFAINTQYYLSILWCTSSFSFILHVQTSHLQFNAATKDCGVQPAYKCST